jgi:endonuclease YncB( thermonuclease family)
LFFKSKSRRRHPWWRVSLGGLLLLAAIAWSLALRWQEFRSQTTSTLRGGWERLDGCVLINNPANDGDSFQVSHRGRLLVVRLYFVDVPEKNLRRDNVTRLNDQARYFGLPDASAAAAVGQAGAEFSLAELSKGPFSIITRHEKVYDSQRIYAQVLTASKQGGAMENLAKKLVREGFARIHTKGESIPNDKSESEFKRELKSLEEVARRQRRNGWSGWKVD